MPVVVVDLGEMGVAGEVGVDFGELQALRLRQGQAVDRGPARPGVRAALHYRAKHRLVGLAAVFISFNAHI